jgi:AraC-like DNA-binding protein
MGARNRTYSLSEMLLTEYRVEGAVCLLMTIPAGASIALNPKGRKTLHLILEGQLPITLADGSVKRLATGDWALVSYGERHTLGSGPPTEIAPPQWDPLQMADQPLRLHAGEPEGQTQGEGRALVLTFILTLATGATRSLGIRSVPDLWIAPGGGSSLPLQVDPPRLIAALEGPGSSAMATRLAAFAFTCIQRELSVALLWGEDTRSERTPHSRHVAAIIKQIRARPEQGWTVQSMARAVGMSRSTFAEAFAEATGIAPMTFLTGERMKRAGSLLRAEVLSVQEVGHRVGYPIESSFARAFRRHWGLGPREYQRRHSKAGGDAGAPGQAGNCAG